MGTLLNTERFDHELALHGVTSRRLSQLTGLHETTISRARHGRPITTATLRRIATALRKLPLLDGADLILFTPENGSQKSSSEKKMPTEPLTTARRASRSKEVAASGHHPRARNPRTR
ncbi:MAG: helix-turn-helix domain-containing protein [Steroidobacteraceae bacterium]